MKRLNYYLLGAAALVLASCSQEDLTGNSVNPDGTATVTISLSTPQIQTRAFGDGTTAQKLLYAVYEVMDDNSINLIRGEGYYSQDDESGAETINLNKQMNFKLLTDHTYKFVFWAESENDVNDNATNPYEVSFGDNKAQLSVVYANLNDGNIYCNDENLDAFYGNLTHKITGNISLNVPLYRPFAQINVGTNDLAEAEALNYPGEGKTIQSTIKTTTYSMMNLFDGSIIGESSPVSFSMANIPAKKDGVFPVTGYDYLAMTYILVPEEQETVDVEFNYAATEETLDHTRKVGSAPVQRNHRTNIYGQILTSDADLYVHIEPDFLPEDLEVSEFEMAAALGGTVSLNAPMTLEKQLSVKKDLVLNLNKQQIYSSNSEVTEPYDGNEDKYHWGVVVQTGANLTINGPGSIEDKELPAVTANGGNIIINGGDFYSENGHAVYVLSGKVTINGGTFGKEGVQYDMVINILDSYRKTLNDVRDAIEVKGGEFINFDPSNNKSEGPNTNFVAEGYMVVEREENDDKIYSVIKKGESLVKFEDGKYTCIYPVLPSSVSEDELVGKGGVYLDNNGEPQIFEATGEKINEAMKNASEIYFAPNAEITTGAHKMNVPATGITIHGNGATISGGEQDIAVQYTDFVAGSTVNLNVYDLNNVEVWGGPKQDFTLNVNLKNCTLVDNSARSLIMIRADEDPATVNLNLENCYLRGVNTAIHSTYGGKIVVKDCVFESVGVPVNYAKKLADHASEVIVKDCIFDKCGLKHTGDINNDNIENYAAPVRVVDNGGPAKNTKLLVENCEFTNTLSDCQILLIEYRTNKERAWYPIDFTNNTNVEDSQVWDTTEKCIYLNGN